MAKFVQAVINLFKNRPALVLGLLSAALTLAAAFGFHVTSGQSGAILAFLQAVIALFANASTVSKAKYNALVEAIKQRAGA